MNRSMREKPEGRSEKINGLRGGGSRKKNMNERVGFCDLLGLAFISSHFLPFTFYFF